MKILSLFFAIFLLMLQGTSGFMRAPHNDVQCKQAGGTCSANLCPLPNMRPFGHCQQGVPCCRAVLVQTTMMNDTGFKERVSQCADLGCLGQVHRKPAYSTL